MKRTSTLDRSDLGKFLPMLGLAGLLACSRPPGAVVTHLPGDAGPDGSDAAGVLADLPAPRLIAPLSTATVTSQRPTLRWVRAEGTDAVHVEICADRACTRKVTSFDAVDSGAPAAPLPPGVLFWRAFGRSGGTRGRAASPTWQLTVGKISAPVDTSWGTTPDVNGDGYADVLVGAATGATVSVYLGGASGLATSPQVVLHDVGAAVASAGDVNGDGYADVVASGKGVDLYLGGPAGLSADPAVVLPTPDGGAGDFGIRVQSAGDVNGDGYADVVVGDNVAGPTNTPAMGRAYLYYGSATGLSPSPAVVLIGAATSAELGHSVDGAGDVNGDGYGDVIVSAPGTNNGQVYLYLGSEAGLAASPAVTIDCPAGNYGGCRMAAAGDVNGDGYADMILGVNVLGAAVGQAYIYLGSASGLATSPASTLIGPETAIGDSFGRWVATAGDLNGDGYADVVVGADAEGDRTIQIDGGMVGPPGWVHVYLGSPTGVASSPAVTLSGPDGPGSRFGRSVTGAGDVNGDGYGDLIVGAEGDGITQPGWAHLYLGTPTGLAPSPAATLTSPSGSSQFGLSVASVSGLESPVLDRRSAHERIE
jgi:FG-GAP-like repeat/FG-GAP repeat